MSLNWDMWTSLHFIMTEKKAEYATIHLFDSGKFSDKTDENEDGEVDLAVINSNVLNILKCQLRRGDLLEDIAQSGYRSQGLYIYNGEQITQIAYSLDDYGCIGREYVVYREFGPMHWSFGEMSVNDQLCPGESSAACWHSGDLPSLYVDTEAIRNSTNNEIEFQGVVYRIPDELKEYVDDNIKNIESTNNVDPEVSKKRKNVLDDDEDEDIIPSEMISYFDGCDEDVVTGFV